MVVVVCPRCVAAQARIKQLEAEYAELKRIVMGVPKSS